jgi:hypothetical protein
MDARMTAGVTTRRRAGWKRTYPTTYEEDEPDVGVLDAESGDDAGSTVSDQDGTDNNRSIKPSASVGTMEPIPGLSNKMAGTCNKTRITKIRLLLPLLLVLGGNEIMGQSKRIILDFPRSITSLGPRNHAL